MSDIKSLLHPPVKSSPGGWLVAVVLLACGAGVAQRSLEVEQLRMNAANAHARMEKERRASDRAEVRLSPDQARHWQSLRAEIAFPWENVFRVLERATSEDIELLEMVPDKGRRTVVLRGEARNVTTIVAYLQSLAGQPEIGEAFISRMQRLERTGLQTVEFEIRMTLT